MKVNGLLAGFSDLCSVLNFAFFDAFHCHTIWALPDSPSSPLLTTRPRTVALRPVRLSDLTVTFVGSVFPSLDGSTW